jgi:hypothetical protein
MFGKVVAYLKKTSKKLAKMVSSKSKNHAKKTRKHRKQKGG